MKTTDDGNGKTRILIIDDDQSFCDVYKSLLEGTDKYSVTTAGDGREGLLLAKNQNPDVILLDILMPRLDGGDVACLLSCNEATKETPYIFVTSLVKPNENSINNKHHYLGKPIDLEDLTSTIEEVIKHGYPNPLCLQ
jgi:CheY-like chemotaxis protein